MTFHVMWVPLLAIFISTTAAAQALEPEIKCFVARYRVAAKYAACVEGVVKVGRKSHESCTERYFDAFDKLRARFPATPCDKPRFVDNADGTVTDNLTGRVWEKKTGADGIANLSNPHDVDNLYTWTNGDADETDEDGTAYTDFLASLNAGAGFAGSNGWRLPTVEELLTITIAQPCPMDSCVDPIFGPTGVDDGRSEYWSSSTHSDATYAARSVDFYIGTREMSHPKANTGFVRAVRAAW